MSRRRTQAVVVIHGIGEQKPMDTLRGFVESVLPEPDEGEQYFSKPAPLAETLELRKLQDRDQPRTHFYEYYWASKVEGTSFLHVGSWLKSLLWRRPSRVPPQIRLLWVLTWVLLAATLAGWGLYGLEAKDSAGDELMPFWVPVLTTVLFGALQFVVLNFVGDAARYLAPFAGNIALRQKIRADGIRLLRNLHASQKPDGRDTYDRIVVVGHSLGSVIAYDLVNFFWQEMSLEYKRPSSHDQEKLAQVERLGEALAETPDESAVREFQGAQTRLWWELRELGNRWRITDLITLGSPLAHAALLLARDAEELDKRQRQRELATCPPIPETDPKRGLCYSFRVWDKYRDEDGDEHSLRALHHAAVFAVTRWTNLYFRTRLALFGDFVSGRIAPWFGRGILDRRVTVKSPLRTHTPLAHISYWGIGEADEQPATQELIAALDRDGVRTYRDLADAAEPDATGAVD